MPTRMREAPAFSRTVVPVFVGTILAGLLALAVWSRIAGEPPALLWLDEAWRVRQVLDGTEQGVVLLSEAVLVRLSTFLFGVDERGYRLWPLLGVLFAIGAVARLRGSLFRTPVWLWTCLTFALASGFVMHTREFKPYGIDLALTMAVATTAVNAAAGKSRGLLACTAASSVMAASTIVFPFVHAATTLFLVSRRRFPAAQLATTILVPAAVFAVVYAAFLRQQAGVEQTAKFWASLFLDSREHLQQIVRVAGNTASSYSFFGPAVLWGTALVVAPLVSIVRRDGFWMFLVVPLAVQAAFSALGLYPLFDRPSFYYYGLCALALPYVLDGVLSLLRKDVARTLGALLLLVAGASWLWASGAARQHWEAGVRWPPRPDARVVLETLAREFEPGDRLFVNDGLAHTFVLYAPRYFPAASPLGSYTADWSSALRNRSVRELCFHLMLRAKDLESGATAWFASAHTRYAARYYFELLRRVGKADILVDEDAASLLRVRLERPMSSLEPLCQQLWTAGTNKSGR